MPTQLELFSFTELDGKIQDALILRRASIAIKDWNEIT